MRKGNAGIPQLRLQIRSNVPNKHCEAVFWTDIQSSVLSTATQRDSNRIAEAIATLVPVFHVSKIS